MIIVPLQAVPNQTVNVQLGGQYVILNVYEKFYGLFMDVYANGNLIVAGVICENLNRIVRDLYLGFLGDFIWIDNQGSTDPVYTGIGARYSLAYLETIDLNGEG
jgi:hypothetical protein